MMSCAKKEEGFNVKFELNNIDNQRVYIQENVPNIKKWYIDSIEIKNGSAEYKGKVEFPKLTTFIFTKNGRLFKILPLFLSNKEITVKGDLDDFDNIKITGSSTNDEYVKIKKGYNNILKEYKRTRYLKSKTLKTNKYVRDSLTTRLNELYENMYNYFICLPNIKTSEIIPFFVCEHFNGNISKIDNFLKLQDSSLYSNPYVMSYKSNNEREKRVQDGCNAFDFSLKDLDGKNYKLSDFKGKYVLLEFSASWCGWCKKEIPYLKRLYKKTRNKNFEMFTINLDKKRNLWEKEVKEEKLPWKVLSDLKAFSGPVAKEYNIHGIPQIFLISPDGKIVKRGLRGDYMINYINDLLK